MNSSKTEWGRPLIKNTKERKLKSVVINFIGTLSFFNFSKITLLSCVFLVVFSRAELVGGLSPFLPALYTALVIEEKNAWLPYTASALVGLWLFNGQGFFINTAVLLMLFIIVSFFGKKMDRLYIVSIAVAATILTVKGFFVILEGYVFYKIASLVFEGILAGSLVPAYLEVLNRLYRGERKIWNREGLLGLFLLCFGILIAIGDYSVLGFSIRDLISRYIILLLAYKFGSGISTPAGVALGLVPSLATIVSPQMVGLYALSGLLGGLFKRMGKIMVALGFLVGHFLLSIYIADPWEMDSLFLETLLAIVLFLITPANFLEGIKTLLPAGLIVEEESEREMVVSRLAKLSEVFRELSRTFRQVSGGIEEGDNPGLDKLINIVARKTCKGCAVFAICWQKDLENTSAALQEMFRIAGSTGIISSEEIPYQIRKRCQNTSELALTISCLHDTYLFNQYWHKRINETRNLVSEQLYGVSEIMGDLSQQLQVSNNSCREKELQLTSGLQDLGLSVEKTHLEILPGGIEIQVVKEPCQRGHMECDTLIKGFAQEMFGEKFAVDRSNCALKTGTLTCHCRLLPSVCYTVEIGFAAFKGAGNLVSGDSFWHGPLKGGKHIVLLSDGMGIGPSANRESSATIQLFKQLLNNGFNVDTAIKTVNSVLGMRSEETFSTVDLACIDLYSGAANFFKIGASPSFIKRGKAVGVVTAFSVPLGIVNEVDVYPIEKIVKPGDIILMMTDGVLEANRDCHDKEAWMQSVIRELEEDNAQEMAELTLKHALAVAGETKDDMSVAVIRISKR